MQEYVLWLSSVRILLKVILSKANSGGTELSFPKTYVNLQWQKGKLQICICKALLTPSFSVVKMGSGVDVPK